MKCWMWCLTAVLFTTGCEKNIDLSIHNQAPALVVDASIENDKAPVVILSTSLNYFSSISPADLAASFVHGAHITVGNGSETVILKEFAQTDSAGFTFYYYTANEGNPDSMLLGAFNTTYQMNITTPDGKNYTSATTIPTIAKKLDSLWWKQAPNNPDTSRCTMWGMFTDPPGLGNYIRYFTRVDKQPFLPGQSSVFDDQITDGKKYSLSFAMGFDKNTIDPDREDYGFAHRGDTVTVKFANIDKATFDFWRTWEFSYQSTNNPFSSPVTVLSNISNGGLGVFAGYAAEYKTIIIPK